MHSSFRCVKALVWACAATVLAGSAIAQDKPTLKISDYGQWEMLRRASISNDGRWMIIQVGRVDGETYTVIRNCDTPDKILLQNVGTAEFSEDSKWAAYLIGPSKKEADALREQKKPIETKLGLKNMATGTETVFEKVQNFSFTENSKFLVMAKQQAPDQPGAGDLVVYNLGDGTSITLTNVALYDINKQGDIIALVIESGPKSRGVQLFYPETNSVKQLLWGKDMVSSLGFAPKSNALAFYVGTENEKKVGLSNTVYHYKDVTKSLKPEIFNPNDSKEFPKDYRIVEAPIGMPDDGSYVEFGIGKWEDKVQPSGKPEDKPNVDVWHYKDNDAYPLQQRRSQYEKNRAFPCLWKDGKFISITLSKTDRAFPFKNGKYAMIIDSKPYESPLKEGGITYQDSYIVNLATGEKNLILKKSKFNAYSSAEGNYSFYFKEKQWWLYNNATGSTSCITKDIKADFTDVDYDGPQAERPFERVPLWLKDDKALILFDKYDCYLVDPVTLNVKKVTDGADDRAIYRPIDIDDDEELPSVDKPIYFSVFTEDTKKSGLALLDPKDGFKVLTIDDKLVGGFVRAKASDRVMFTMESFEEPPAVYITNSVFSQAKPVQKTNEQQAKYAWGKTQLISYKALGKDLHGILVYPANYKPGKMYPMITYIYERLSDGLHSYEIPNERNSYDVQGWSQNGYFVLQPDITYKTRQPGVSANICLGEALKAVFAKHVGVDPQKVGLVGHSWGAYQTAFTVTTTKLFAAGVAGAPLTDLVEMYNSFYWNSGESNQVIFEGSQGRMDVPWWKDLKAYMDNSPVFQADKLTKPLMIAFGDSDGAVDWHQGQFFFNTLKRMGKFIVMLVYPGENHGLARKPNQIDYANKVRHFFDVYLKGVKPEPWLSEGMPYLKKLEEQAKPETPKK